MPAFTIARVPRIEFGRGVFARVPDLAKQYGNRVLLVSGGQSFLSTSHYQTLIEQFQSRSITWWNCTIREEPSPALIDDLAQQHREFDIDVVLGVGGGSALDAAKAIAGLLRVNRSVMDYLEGVGPELPYTGPAVPLIAAPTTAGTGSEATKNAVLSVTGRNGFKKSFRHDRLVAEYAVVDPDLLKTCPPELIAANGMDALTQLMESYVSTRANPFTDALAVSGLRAARDSLLQWYQHGAEAPTECLEGMAYAALNSGITLAQTGLGSVHGLAAPLGAFFSIPHGVACGTLVARATEVNITTMRTREPHNPGLDRYARLGEILCRRRHRSREESWDALVALLYGWTEQLALPSLQHYGVTAADFDHIVRHSRGSSMKTNPISLRDEEICAVLAARLR